MPVLGLVAAFFAVSMLTSCGSETKTEETEVVEAADSTVVEEAPVVETTTDSTAVDSTIVD